MNSQEFADFVLAMTVEYVHSEDEEVREIVVAAQMKFLHDSGCCYESGLGLRCVVERLHGGQYDELVADHIDISAAVVEIHENHYSAEARHIAQLRAERKERKRGVKLYRRTYYLWCVPSKWEQGQRLEDYARGYEIITKGRLVSAIRWVEKRKKYASRPRRL